MLSVAVETLGCKLNQLESESILERFISKGFCQSGWAPGTDLFILNTCTVTSKAEQKARRLIRQVLRDFSPAPLIVTGCYAEMEEETLDSLERECGGDVNQKRLFTVPGSRKNLLLDLAAFLARPAPDAGESGLAGRIGGWLLEQKTAGKGGGPRSEGAFCFEAGGFIRHSRGFLKIQDGCDRACSYCRVTLARGPSVSRSREDILAALRNLEGRGYSEAVLTGVNISQYRDVPDRGGSPVDLTGLLAYLLEGTQRIALRLSSIEPDEISGAFSEVLMSERIRPHFHIALQSGSAYILERMRRPYGPEDLERAALLLRSVKPDPFLACDVIAGFPGEGPAEFEETYELCRRIGFAGIHAFPYSRRPGTEAFSFKEHVTERDATERVNALMDLARRDRSSYIERWLGKTIEAVVETGPREEGTCLSALSENYLRLRLPSKAGGEICRRGSALTCRIVRLSSQEAQEGRFDAAGEILVANS